MDFLEDDLLQLLFIADVLDYYLVCGFYIYFLGLTSWWCYIGIKAISGFI
jgi:hypothetical protein